MSATTAQQHSEAARGRGKGNGVTWVVSIDTNVLASIDLVSVKSAL